LADRKAEIAALVEAEKVKIIEFMRGSRKAVHTDATLFAAVGAVPDERYLFDYALGELLEAAGIVRVGASKFALPERSGLIQGRLFVNERAFGFVTQEPPLPDIFIAPRHMNGALDQDVVLVAPIEAADARGAWGAGGGGTPGMRGAGGAPGGAKGPRSRPGRITGEVVRIVEPAITTLVGTVEVDREGSYTLIPDNKKVFTPISISPQNRGGARAGQKALVEIVSRRSREEDVKLSGKVVEVIGFAGDPGVDILSILVAHGFSAEFPEAAAHEADATPERPDGRRFRGRRDLRALRLFTIDGADSKDLDDAVSIERLPPGDRGGGTESGDASGGGRQAAYRLGVHIADVSSYVAADSALDREALSRGTSLYFADRVIPMLPQKLSNGVCSLHPHVDRLALSVFMDIDARGNVLAHEICESLINSAERMTYSDVYRILEEGDAELRERYAHITDDLFVMKELALALRERRMGRGAVDFALNEAKIELDGDGAPISVEVYEITLANRIIEEFMIACNETVAEHMAADGAPFIYRTHDKPDPKRVESFAALAAMLGFPLRVNGAPGGVGGGARYGGVRSGELQAVLTAAQGSPYEKTLAFMMLRSLAKARYTAENIGHFGLASDCYCHFTSPIRRYPDLLIHRIIKARLKKGGFPRALRERYENSLPGICISCSERERAADEAEMEIAALKKAEYMKRFVGDVFLGTVSGVTSFGLFIALGNTVEGLVRLADIDDDFYVYDERRCAVFGERTGKRYAIGDPVKVQVARVSVELRQIDFALLTGKGEENRKKRSKHKKNKKA
jgi:ribonuclease R